MEIKEHHIAGIGKRLGAYIIDIFPIVLLVFGAFYFFLGFDQTLENYLNRGTDIEPRRIFMKQRNWIREISFLIWLLYCIVMESSPQQGSYGKQLMGIKVVDEFG